MTAPTCTTRSCGELATKVIIWPLGRRRPKCDRCADMAAGVARGVGIDLRVEPLPPEQPSPEVPDAA